MHEITSESVTIAFPTRLAERLSRFTGRLVMVERMPGASLPCGVLF